MRRENRGAHLIVGGAVGIPQILEEVILRLPLVQAPLAEELAVESAVADDLLGGVRGAGDCFDVGHRI